VNNRLNLIAQLHWGQGGPEHERTSCTDSECTTCAILLCPFGEPLHYHHDGCPACHWPELTKMPLVDWRTYYR
jgi:hypothetical protein